MKTLLLAGATLALLTAVNFPPAMAQGPKFSSGHRHPVMELGTDFIRRRS